MDWSKLIGINIFCTNNTVCILPVMKLPAIFFVLIFPLVSLAQLSIKGKVVNASTGAVIPGCSVFIANTSKGTTADGNGHFELSDIPPGKHDLIVSSVGYETSVFSFTDRQLPLQLKIELVVKVKELDNVDLEAYVEEGWDKWGKIFTDNFIGTSANALQCKIRNPKAIRFRYYKKSNRLVAIADEAVVVENKALGYVLTYQLEDFVVNFSERSATFLGYSLFEDMDKGGKTVTQRRQNKRREAYDGSIMHFMRALYENKLAEEGFEVRRMQWVPNVEKQRVRELYRKASEKNMLANNGVLKVETGKQLEGIPADSVEYYRKILFEKDYFEVYGKELLQADSLIIATEGAYKGMHFEKYIFVTYKNALEEERYISSQLSSGKPGPRRSFVLLLNEKLITIDKNGNYYNPQDFFTSGYWGWSEKMANSLPLDYEPAR